MDKGISILLCKLQSMLTGFVIYITVKNNLCSERLRAVHLDQRCGGRHYNDSLAAIGFCCIGNTLCMIAGRRRDQTLCAFFLRKSADLIIRTAHLIGAGPLHILRLQIYLSASLLAVIV